MDARVKGETPPLLLLPPERIPDDYDIEAFEKAELYRRATGNPVFNPLRIQPESLGDINVHWMNAQALFDQWLKYFTDMHQRPEGLR